MEIWNRIAQLFLIIICICPLYLFYQSEYLPSFFQKDAPLKTTEIIPLSYQSSKNIARTTKYDIGKSLEFAKRVNRDFNILHNLNLSNPNINSTTIPKILFCTTKGKKMNEWHQEHRENYISWQGLLKDWDIRFYSDADIELFVLQEVAADPELAFFVPFWQSLPIVIEKIDAVRYLWLFKYGGLYADMDVLIFQDPTPLFHNKSLFLTAPEEAKIKIAPMGVHIGNWFMASTPRHPFWLHVLHRIAAYFYTPTDFSNITIFDSTFRKKKSHILAMTGPQALGNALQSWPGDLKRLGLGVCPRNNNGFFDTTTTGTWTNTLKKKKNGPFKKK